jgi:hypothetical protein
MGHKVDVLMLRKFAARCHHAEEFCIVDDSIIVLVRFVCLFTKKRRHLIIESFTAFREILNITKRPYGLHWFIFECFVKSSFFPMISWISSSVRDSPINLKCRYTSCCLIYVSNRLLLWIRVVA